MADGVDGATNEIESMLLVHGALGLLASRLGPYLQSKLGPLEQLLPSTYQSEGDPAAQLRIVWERWRNSRVGVEERLARRGHDLLQVRNRLAHHSLNDGDDELSLKLVELMLRDIGFREATTELAALRDRTRALARSSATVESMQLELDIVQAQLLSSREERADLQAELDRLQGHLGALEAAQAVSPAANQLRERIESVSERLETIDIERAQNRESLEARLTTLLNRVERLERERAAAPAIPLKPPLGLPAPSPATSVKPPPDPPQPVTSGEPGQGNPNLGPDVVQLRAAPLAGARGAFTTTARRVALASAVGVVLLSGVGALARSLADDNRSTSPTTSDASSSPLSTSAALSSVLQTSTVADTTVLPSSEVATTEPTIPATTFPATTGPVATAPPATPATTTTLLVFSPPPPPAYDAELALLMSSTGDAEKSRVDYLAQREASYQELISSTASQGYIDQKAETEWLARDSQLEWDLEHSDYQFNIDKIAAVSVNTREVIELQRQLLEYYRGYLHLHESSRFAAEDWANYYHFTGPDWPATGGGIEVGLNNRRENFCEDALFLVARGGTQPTRTVVNAFCSV